MKGDRNFQLDQPGIAECYDKAQSAHLRCIQSKGLILELQLRKWLDNSTTAHHSNNAPNINMLLA